MDGASSGVRSLGIDFGEARIGLAISDPGGRMAVPLTTVERRNDRSALREIHSIALREGVGRFVLGEPLGLGGERGENAVRVRRFGERLAELSGLPVRFVNESLTTVEAQQRMREAGIDPRKDPARVDAIAAQILLQEALDTDPAIQG